MRESDAKKGQNYYKGARTVYRWVIVICALALIVAIVVLYLTGTLDQVEVP